MLILAETKCSDDLSLRPLVSYGFDSMEIIPSQGLSGGMAMLWKSNCIKVQLIDTDRQFFHARCELPDPLLFFLTPIYAIPHSNLRSILWSKLKVLSAAISLPWIVLGDFNDIMSASERVGGVRCNPQRLKWFSDRSTECGLSDMGFQGPRFTWKGPKLPDHSRLFERLDRAFGNARMFSELSGCFIKVLTRTSYSDHNPLMLQFQDELRVNLPRPFKFEAMWLSHESFDSFLLDNWSTQAKLNVALSDFQLALINWNKDCFGLIEARKRNLLARLKGIQNSPNYPSSSFLCSLEKELQAELDLVLRREELKWFQKARTEWIAKGDRNTRFYHLKAKMRHRRNSILMLKDEHGNWIDYENALRDMVVSYFQNLYQAVDSDFNWLTTVTSFPPLVPELLKNLGAVPLNEEIKRALFSLGAFKAPGFDGYPPIFFQSKWNIVGESLCNFVKSVFEGSEDLSVHNNTLISLIPKRDRPEIVGHFRPISLCSVHYKVVMKVITGRLRGLMDTIVSPFQASFIKGRQIHDNIIVGQEVLHTMKKIKGRKGLMALKIDLEKAYDRIQWDFLRNVLVEVGFEPQFINLIMHCVTTVSFNILWNGSKTMDFEAMRGLRQGDPLSPLLFVLCMDIWVIGSQSEFLTLGLIFLILCSPMICFCLVRLRWHKLSVCCPV
ncbi:hypothetical protein QN277_013544 [Acacia crassicarpa]|uniref:Reverse transcriptase domain-containing protein n=1 Tax=Acacia crassicarpa TaxID=499986 RepID=A0AAE1N3G6_9FABA|nr:hypothetical protein QN277_013544 [Acacia crassicarpa]